MDVDGEGAPNWALTPTLSQRGSEEECRERE